MGFGSETLNVRRTSRRSLTLRPGPNHGEVDATLHGELGAIMRCRSASYGQNQENQHSRSESRGNVGGRHLTSENLPDLYQIRIFALTSRLAAGSGSSPFAACLWPSFPWRFSSKARGQKVYEGSNLCGKMTAMGIDRTYRQRGSRIVVQYRSQATRLQRIADHVVRHGNEALPFTRRPKEYGCVVGFQISLGWHVERLSL